MTQKPPVGLLIGSHIPPADIGALASLAERCGFGEVWLTEDLWFTSGVVAAGAALAATETIPVGLGIQSAVTRHPSIQALDFATLGQVYPGRFWPGIGLGLPAWLDQMGVRPPAPLRAVRETFETVRALLAGETVSVEGSHVARKIALAHPPDPVPPLYIGAVGPKSVVQAGKIADGFIASALSGTAYVSWVRELLDEGAAAAGRTRARVVTFALFNCDDDARAARDAIRSTFAFYLSAMVGTELLTVYGIDAAVRELMAGGIDRLAAQMPEEWLEDLAIAGTPAECAGKIEDLRAAGSDSVILFPAPADQGAEIVERAGSAVLPLLASA